MLGHKLITKQTGISGRICQKVSHNIEAFCFTNKASVVGTDRISCAKIHNTVQLCTCTCICIIMQVLVVEKMNLLSEFYFAIVLDRAFMVSLKYVIFVC